jgi:hypothetical protein
MQAESSAQHLRIIVTMVHNPPAMFIQMLAKPKSKRCRPSQEARP